MSPTGLLASASLLALAVPSVLYAQSAQSGSTDTAVSDSRDIVVTATRRNESVLSVPYNISAVDGDTLEAGRISDFNGLRTLIPGLTAPDYGARANGRNNAFIIRGVNTDSVGGGTTYNPKLQSASVSTYIDETPVFTNLRMNDVARVEVLRGPQGTLYGAGSVGGTIRLIQNKPDPTKFEYKISGKISGVHASSDTSWGLDAVVNIPLSETLAFRASAGYDRTAGFIDGTAAVRYDSSGQPILATPGDPLNSGYVTTTINDLDWSKAWFGRASLLWQVTDNLEAQFVYHHQNDKSGGFSKRGINDTRYTTSRPIPVEPSDRDTDLASMTLTADLGFATMTSATSYTEISQDDFVDFTGPLTPFLFPHGGYPRLTSPLYNETKDENFTQEIRFVSNGDGPFSWVAGAYYQKLKQRFYEYETVPGIAAWSELPGSDFYLGFPNFGDAVQFYNGGTRPSATARRDQVYQFDRLVNFRDIAAFAELTYEVTPRWQVTAGGRVFWQRLSQNTGTQFPLCGLFCGSNALGETVVSGVRDDQSQIFKGNTSYKITDALTAYLTVSQGYRSGGANAYPVGNCVVCDPPEFLNYDPDTAVNYELGLKGRLSRAVRFSAAIYQIDWKKIQLEAGSTSGNPIVVNGKTARSRGVEFEGNWQATPNLSLTFGYAYVDAILTQDFSLGTGGTTITGTRGDKLPGVSDHQLNGAIDLQLPLAKNVLLTSRIDGFYRSSAVNQVNTTTNNFARIDGFGMVNASLGVEIDERYTVQAFIDNIGNEDGVTAINKGTASAPAYTPSEFLSRPRTVGLRVVIRN